MTVRDLTKELKSLKPSLQDKEVFVIAKNGLLLEPKIKQKYRNAGDIFDANKEPEAIIIGWE